MRQALHVACVVALLAGCASGPSGSAWLKAWEHDGIFEQVWAKCDYETSIVVQTSGAGLPTTSGSDYDRDKRKKGLQEQCMAANGWVPARNHMLKRPL